MLRAAPLAGAVAIWSLSGALAQPHRSENDFPVRELQVHGRWLIQSDRRLPAATWNRIRRTLSRLESDVARTLRIPRSRATVDVRLIHEPALWHRQLATHGASLTRRSAVLVARPRAPALVLVRATGRLDRDLRHEATHALLRPAFPILPLWLDEGLAEYFEMPPDRSEHLAAARRAPARGWRADLARLEKQHDPAALTERDYRTCWALVTFFLHHSDRSAALLAAYLDQLRRGEPTPLLSERLDRHWPAWHEALVPFFHRSRVGGPAGAAGPPVRSR